MTWVEKLELYGFTLLSAGLMGLFTIGETLGALVGMSIALVWIVLHFIASRKRSPK